MSIYIFIFLAMALIMSKANFNASQEMFHDVKVKVAIQNDDTTNPITEGFIQYMKEHAIFVDLPSNPEKRQDALYYRVVDTILIIPAGFTDALIRQAQVSRNNSQEVTFPTIGKVSIPQSNTAYYSDLLVNRYFETTRIYLTFSPAMDMEEMKFAILNDLSQNAETTFYENDTTASGINRNVYYYNYLAYSLFATFILGIGTIMTVFNETNLKNRTFASPLKSSAYNIQLLMGTLSFALIIFLGMNLLSFALYWKYMITLNGLLLVLNSFVFTLSTLAVSFLIGNIVKNRNAQSAAANVVTLGTCFISGVFVPQELLGKSVLQVASFTPTYWFVKVNEAIGRTTTFQWENLRPIFGDMLIELIFGLAILGVTLVLLRQRQQEER